MEGQETGVGVCLSGVHVIDALGDPFGLARVVHDAEVGTDLGHTRDGAGIQVQEKESSPAGARPRRGEPEPKALRRMFRDVSMFIP